jgi:hypothetical protein
MTLSQADLDKIHDANIKVQDINSHKHADKVQKATNNKLCEYGVTNKSFQDLVNTINRISKIQGERSEKREQGLYNKEEIDKRNQANNTVTNYLNTLIIANNKTKNTLDILVSDYSNENTNTTNTQELYNKHITEVSNLRSKINDYIGIVQTDNRKSFYENKKTTFSDDIRYYIKIIYYILLVIYLWYARFFQNKLYKNYYVCLILTVYILIPFIIKYLVEYIFYIWDWFYNGFINTSDYNKEWFIKRE